MVLLPRSELDSPATLDSVSAKLLILQQLTEQQLVQGEEEGEAAAGVTRSLGLHLNLDWLPLSESGFWRSPPPTRRRKPCG